MSFINCIITLFKRLVEKVGVNTWHTGGRVNLNFLAPPYGVAFLNP